MGSLFKTPAAPEIKAAAPAPQESELAKARKRKMQSETQTGGTSSTLLSSGGRETLGA
jgi:hypothetical protein